MPLRIWTLAGQAYIISTTFHKMLITGHVVSTPAESLAAPSQLRVVFVPHSEKKWYLTDVSSLFTRII